MRIHGRPNESNESNKNAKIQRKIKIKSHLLTHLFKERRLALLQVNVLRLSPKHERNREQDKSNKNEQT
jgi:hypothetical protein